VFFILFCFIFVESICSLLDAKLEDITFEYKPSALDQFFSPILPNKNEQVNTQNNSNDMADGKEIAEIEENSKLIGKISSFCIYWLYFICASNLLKFFSRI
jgi:hypothetical protein